MLKVSIHGTDLVLETHEALFSPRSADVGTLSMLSQVTFSVEDKILDL